MSAHTKTRPTRQRTTSKQKTAARRVHWREAFKKEIEKYGEAGLALRSSRLKEELTQEELGEKVGVSQNHISEMEHGKRTIGKEIAKRFASFFKVDYRIFL